MQPDVKLSKFMFHIKFADSSGYLNEHELYEVMRSRNLYQDQFGVRSNYNKVMRNIAIAEKAQRYSFENSRKLFVQRMKERREQADKLRFLTSSLKPKQFGDMNAKRKVERRYVPIPKSTTIYSEFPAIVPIQRANSPPAISEISELSLERSTSRTSLPVPPTPSMIAATLYTDDISQREDDLSPLKVLCQEQGRYKPLLKGDVNGRVTPTKTSKLAAGRTLLPKLISPIPELHQRGMSDQIHNDFGFMNEEELKRQEEFVKKTKKGRGKLITSTIHMPDGTDDHGCTKIRRRHPQSDPTEKCEAWREKHAIVSKETMHDDSFLKRLLIDRPSKFTLSHVQDIHLLDVVDLRYRMIKKIAKEMNKSSRSKVRQDDTMSDKVQLKTKTYISLPELDTTPKPMATFDPGGTTPDGRLILTKADYDDYLAGYRKARTIRLEKAKKHEQDVGKQVGEFEVRRDLRIKQPTRLKMPAPMLSV